MKTTLVRWIKIDNEREAQKAIQQMGGDPGEIALMASRAIARALKIENVPLAEALQMKEEMISVGGDATVNRDRFISQAETTDMLLVGNHEQFRQFSQKLQGQRMELGGLEGDIAQVIAGLEPKTKRSLNCCGKVLTLGERTLIMGILNVTPDSFSDGGRFFDPERALEQALQLIAEGADILDIGAESTRLNNQEVTAEEEWRRLEPVLKALAGKISIPISVDTYKAAVAERALEAGANIINDVWGLQRDGKLAEVVGKYQSPVVVMHNQVAADYHHLMGDILAFLRRSICLAENSGLRGDQIIVDPGIGGAAFGKTYEYDLEIMSRLEEFKGLGHPVLLGTSRKSMIGNTLNLPVSERVEGTIATSVVGVAAGVDIIRVHDLEANRRAVAMADAIYRRKRGERFVGE